MSERELKSESQANHEARTADSPMGELVRAKIAAGQRQLPPPGEKIAIACVRWQERPIRDCVKDKCQRCGVNIAVSPSAQAMIEDHDGPADLWCLDCAWQQRSLEEMMSSALLVPEKGR